jgi:hypothetical protein
MSTGLQVTSQSNFVHEVLLRRGKIELINQEIFSSALFIEFGELKGVEQRRGTGCRTGVSRRVLFHVFAWEECR